MPSGPFWQLNLATRPFTCSHTPLHSHTLLHLGLHTVTQFYTHLHLVTCNACTYMIVHTCIPNMVTHCCTCSRVPLHGHTYKLSPDHTHSQIRLHIYDCRYSQTRMVTCCYMESNSFIVTNTLHDCTSGPMEGEGRGGFSPLFWKFKELLRKRCFQPPPPL